MSSHSSHHVEWDTRINNTVVRIANNSRANKLEHLKLARKSKFVYKIFIIASMLLGPLGSLLTTLNDMYIQRPAVPIIITIIGYLSGISGAALKFGKYDEKTNSHKQAVARYTSIENNIIHMLSLPLEHRVSADTYLEMISSRYDDIYRASPLIPEPPNDSSNVVIDIHNEPYDSEDTLRRESSTLRVCDLPDLNQYSDKMMQYELNRMQKIHNNTIHEDENEDKDNI